MFQHGSKEAKMLVDQRARIAKNHEGDEKKPVENCYSALFLWYFDMKIVWKFYLYFYEGNNSSLCIFSELFFIFSKKIAASIILP